MDGPKTLIDAPAIDKHCFVYCGDDRCTCSAGPNWPRPLADTPAPIATPEEAGDIAGELFLQATALLNGRRTIEEWENAVDAAIAAALTSSKAEIERVTRERDEALTPICLGRETIARLAAEGGVVFDDGRALVAADDLFQNDPFARVATLTAEVGRMREALALAEDILSRNGSFSTASTWLTKDGETHPMNAITTLRAALASPIEPEGET